MYALAHVPMALMLMHTYLSNDSCTCYNYYIYWYFAWVDQRNNMCFFFHKIAKVLCNSCNIGMRDLPDMYARNPRAVGLRVEGIHIEQITNCHVTSIMYHFVPIVTTPVVLIPQVIIILIPKVISTNC